MVGEHTTTRPRDLEWMANTFVWERGFAWRQSGLRVIQVQLIGLAGYSLGHVLGASLPGGLLLACTTLWSLVHARLRTLDMRRLRDARDTHPVLTGLHAIGGFGGLPAPYARELLEGGPCTPDTGPAEYAESVLHDAGRAWAAEHLAVGGLRETFLLLAGEFSGTAEDLLATCIDLERT